MLPVHTEYTSSTNTDKQTNRQTDKQTNRQTDKQRPYYILVRVVTPPPQWLQLLWCVIKPPQLSGPAQGVPRGGVQHCSAPQRALRAGRLQREAQTHESTDRRHSPLQGVPDQRLPRGVAEMCTVILPSYMYMYIYMCSCEPWTPCVYLHCFVLEASASTTD